MGDVRYSRETDEREASAVDGGFHKGQQNQPGSNGYGGERSTEGADLHRELNRKEEPLNNGSFFEPVFSQKVIDRAVPEEKVIAPQKIENTALLEIGMHLKIDGREFEVTYINELQQRVSMKDISFVNNTEFPIFRTESMEFVKKVLENRYRNEPTEKNTKTQSGEKENVIETATAEEIIEPQIIKSIPTYTINYKYVENDLIGMGGAKTKFKNNIEAIKTLKKIESENRLATADEQHILARYVGWGGISQAFDSKLSGWENEYIELKNLLEESEYAAARSSVNTSHYTNKPIIDGIYQALNQFGFDGGNVLEPSMGIGNFFSLFPEELQNRTNLYGVELDSITARIAKQLYQDAEILNNGFEETTYPNNFFDVAMGNVPFGDYRVYDTEYNRHKFLIHDYFFAKTLDKVRPGGIVAFVTSKGILDKKDERVRKYIAERADLIGAVRLPNTAFASAGTEVTADIIFLQKRERINTNDESWIHIEENENGVPVNNYFLENPSMCLGEMVFDTSMYGENSKYTACISDSKEDISERISKAVKQLSTEITVKKPIENNDEVSEEIPADPNIRNFTYTFIDDKLYYRNNSVMEKSVDNAADGYMDLNIYRYDEEHIFMGHYYIQNGDRMADPEMKLKVDVDAKTVEPVLFVNHGMGIYQDIFETDEKNDKLEEELNMFLSQWSDNIISQGFIENVVENEIEDDLEI